MANSFFEKIVPEQTGSQIHTIDQSPIPLNVLKKGRDS